MQLNIQGKVHIFGDNIDTDQIYPGQFLELVNPDEISDHCLEGANPDFKNEFQEGEIIVAGINFGCGSSREHAAIALKNIGTGAVIAKSFARIFYRNAINMGLPLIICPRILEIVREGESLEIEIKNNRVFNIVTGEEAEIEPVTDYVREILDAGGIKKLLLSK